MYALIKLLHVVAAVVFLGNITTGLFWHAHAARSRDAKLLAHTLAGIIRSDRLFTMPGVIGILLTGFAAAGLGRIPVFGTGWIAWTLVAFTVSGLLFMFLVAPLQRRLLALAVAGASSGAFDEPGYRALARRWELWGAVSILASFAGLALMVLKPEL